jgi:hypothetical protein
VTRQQLRGYAIDSQVLIAIVWPNVAGLGLPINILLILSAPSNLQHSKTSLA